MNTETAVAEVVWVKDRHRLIDAESYERAYGTGDGLALERGYYIANWPPHAHDRSFMDQRVTFNGPYCSRRAAESALADASGGGMHPRERWS